MLRTDYHSRVSLHDIAADNSMLTTREIFSYACLRGRKRDSTSPLSLALSALPSLRLFPRNTPPGASITSFLHDLSLPRARRRHSVRVYAFHKCSFLRIRRPSFIRSRVRRIVKGYFCLRLKQEPPSSPITTAMPLTDLPRSFHFYLRIFAFYIFYTHIHIYSPTRYRKDRCEINEVLVSTEVMIAVYHLSTRSRNR